MRRTPVLARTWLALATVVVALLPAGTAVAAGRPATLPHPVGGFLPEPVRVPAKAGGLGAHASDNLPAGVDLRSNAPAGGDQRRISSCVAWTIGYSIMGYYANRSGGTGAPYSPMFMYLRNVGAGGAPNAGLSPDAVLANTQANGVDTQDDFWQGNYNYQQAPTAAEIANARNFRVSGWSRLFNGAGQGTAAQTVVMQALAAGSPVALGLPVYRDFMYLGAHNLYSTVGAPVIGAHMVAVYGYDSTGVIIRNSWGTGWGNGGDAKLSWAFVTQAAFAAYTVSGLSTPGSPAVQTPAVTALSVNRATPGSTVTVTGSGLAGATSVRFGDTSAAFTAQPVDGATSLAVTVPQRGPGVVDVTVANASGVSGTGPASKFTVVPPPPAITGVSPDGVSIFGGATVTLTGTDLTGVSTVKVGTSAVPARQVTATSLTFVAPAHAAGTLPVTVAGTSGTSGPPGQLTYLSPPPAVIGTLDPAGGLTYKVTPVTITGSDFTGVSRVTADGTPVAFTRVSGTQLKLSLAKHPAGPVALQITTPGGVSEPAYFVYTAPDLPAVTGVSPAAGATYARTPVSITGSGFTDASKLTLNGTGLSFTRVSDSELRAMLPPHAAGAIDLQVTTPGGVSAAGDGDRSTYVAPPVPAVAALTPSSGPNYVSTTVLVDGTDFTGVTRVTANGANVPFTRISDNQLKVTLAPRAAGDVALVVTALGGPSAAATYTAIPAPAPVISGLGTTSATTTTATPLVISGTGLADATRVQIGGTAVAFTKVSDSEIRTVAPPHAAGPAPIVVTTRGGPSAPADFSYLPPPAPVVAGLDIAVAAAGRPVTVMLGGSGFTGARVTLGGAAVSSTVVSDGTLRVQLPAKAAGDYDLVVTGPGGTSAPSRFTYWS